MLFSEIDLHKRSLVIHTLDAEGITTREAELGSDRAAVLAYFATLAGPHRAVVECVQSWYWLRDLLAPSGVDLRLAHAKYVKAISYAKVKTDRDDARMLAQLLRVGLIPDAHVSLAPDLVSGVRPQVAMAAARGRSGAQLLPPVTPRCEPTSSSASGAGRRRPRPRTAGRACRPSGGTGA